MTVNRLSDKFKHFLEQIVRKPVFIAFLINTIFLMLVLCFCDLKYEVSDDFVMATIISGAYDGGNLNPHMIFVNIILGYILMPFYKLFPQISWYFIFQLIFLFLSFTLASYMFLKKNGKIVGGMISVLLLFFFASDAYILVQFTKTAAVVIISNSLVFIWALFENQRKCLIIISGILCLFGTMIRFSTIYLSGAYLLFILAIEFIRLYVKNRSNRKEYAKKVCRIMFWGVFLIGAAFALSEVDHAIYNNNEEYKIFREYNEVRASVMDAPDYGYEAYKEDLKKIGVSENDYYVLRRWNFSDDKVFPVEKLREVANVINRHKKDSRMALGDIYESMQMREIMSYPIVIACVILLVLMILLQKCQWVYGGLITAVAVVLEGYLFVSERVVYRVEYGIFVSAFLCISYFWSGMRMRFVIGKELFRSSIILILVICIYKLPLFVENSAYKGVTDEYRKNYLDEVFYDSWTFDARKYRRVVNKEKPECSLIEEIEKNKNNFYFLDFRTTIQTLYYEWSPFENVNPKFYENSQYFSGITSKFPGMEEDARKYGVDNYFKSLVNDNVYIVDNEGIEQKVLYIQEHYYPNACAELYKTAGGYQIWKLRKE